MPPMLCPVLVGRDRERAALEAALDACRAGRGGVVLLAGEAGVGKSRLVRDVAGPATGRFTLAGRAVPRTVPVPLRPLTEAFQGVLAEGLPAGPDLAPFRPALDRLAGRGGAGADPDEVGPLVLGEAVTRLLGALGRAHGGAVLVIEDLHWADPETLEVVEYLADHLGPEPGACLATVRSGDDSAGQRLARSLRERRAATVLDLAPLEPGDTDRVAAACLGEAELPSALRHFIRTRSEGIPFLVEELLAGLAEADALVETDGGWRVLSRLVATVPLTFAETVERRLAALDPTATRVLEAAALLGRRFDWSLLPAVVDRDEGAVLAALRAAVGAQLVADDPDSGGFRFRHALSRDVVRARLLAPEAARLAARALTALLAADPELGGDACELAAELADTAHDRERAAGLWLETARRALGQGALATAEAALGRARSAAPPEGPVAAAVDEATAHTAALSGHIDEAVEAAGRALGRAAGENDDPARPARLRLLLGRAALTRGRWDVARQQVELALAQGADAGAAERGLRPAALALGAQVAVAEGRFAEAVDLGRVALAEAEAGGVAVAACEALEVLGRVARLGDVGEAEAHFERARRLAERHGLLLWRARALHELGTIDLYTNLSRERFEAARQAAADAGAVGLVALVDLHLSSVSSARWESAESVAAARRCVDASRRLGLSTLGMGLLHLAVGYAQAGDEEAAAAAVGEARAVAGHDPEIAAGIPGRVGLALALRRADFAAAGAALDEAMVILARDPSVFLPFRGLWALLRTVQDRDGAEARAAAAAAVGAQVLWIRSNLLAADAVAAGRAGRSAEAEAALAGARALLEACPPAEVWLALALRLAAEAALADGWGEPGPWLREALAVFASRGLEELASSCRALLRTAGEPVPRRGRGEASVPGELVAAGVTSREVDVLRLVAARLSNREIAARLHLSPRTVERHVANLLVKAGLANRRELAELAVQVGVARP